MDQKRLYCKLSYSAFEENRIIFPIKCFIVMYFTTKCIFVNLFEEIELEALYSCYIYTACGKPRYPLNNTGGDKN